MHSRVPQKDNALDYIYSEGESYLDSREYQAYKALCYRHIERSGSRGLTYRELRRKLGKRYNDRWTADVMDTLEAVGEQWTHYRIHQPPVVKFYTPKEISKIWNLGPLVARAERY